MEKLIVYIKGMKCEGCEKSVAKLIATVGAKALRVSAKEGIAEFEYHPDNIFPKAIQTFSVKDCYASINFNAKMLTSAFA